ncbi:alpha/beta hydrolase [Amycolatopsis endophytica]|uniref:Pimeloyl-ACP methyl ester carboxylesterase n=1 Tax=Amycolatopsis endophytica TaxID=860233 RepID=A0A853B9V7_9PSEU|nr:alpha/beta fold hydrolase [Amycolatopsis endophytica]NYI91471.1 pimeloyl-ACP methyl ester carboxylesterase [Amycolatopsis endophytica]
MFATAADGTKLFHDHRPGPRPVLLIHGFASDSARTWAATGWVRALGERGHLLVDLRGHGHSDRAASGFAPTEQARDVLAVLDAAGMSTVDVVTYSMGGVIGWELARLAPGRIRRMVLGGIGGRPVEGDDLRRVRDGLAGEGLDACIEAVSGSRLTGEAPCPVLLAAGEADEIAADAPEFAAALGVPFVPVPRRNHLTAVSSRIFKQAALDFLDAARAAK